jgi:ribosome-associated protein
MKTLEITHEPIELYKVLKLEGLVSSGGAAKMEIADGRVLLNGQVETQIRKKIVAGDIIGYEGEEVLIRLQV